MQSGLHGPRQHVDLVHTGRTDVDVEDVGSGRHLRQGFLTRHRQIARAQSLGQALLAGRVDALADEHSGTAATDDDFTRQAQYSGLHFSLPT